MVKSIKAQRGYSPIQDFLPLLLGISLLLAAVFVVLAPSTTGGQSEMAGYRWYVGIGFSVVGLLSLLYFLIPFLETLRYGHWINRDLIDACQKQVREICVAAGHPESGFSKQFRVLRDQTMVAQLLEIHPEEKRPSHLKALETLMGRLVSQSDRLDTLADELLRKGTSKEKG